MVFLMKNCKALVFTAFWGALLFLAQTALPQSMDFTKTVAATLDDQIINVPLKISINPSEADDTLVYVKVSVNLDQVLPTVSTWLENSVDEKDKGCRERWDGSDPQVFIHEGAIALGIKVRVEKWLCEEFLGEEIKTKLFRESASIQTRLVPSIANDRLLVELQDFSMTGLSDPAELLGVRDMVEQELRDAIREFNQDENQTKLPDEWMSLGIAMKSLSLFNDGQSSASLVLSAPSDLGLFLDILLRTWGQD